MARKFTNFPLGSPVVGNNFPAFQGNYYFVDYTYGSDTNGSGTRQRPFKTIAFAYTKVTTNNDDVIVLMGQATHVLTEMLTISKNRVTIASFNGGTGRAYGEFAKISIGAVAGQTGTILNTGVRNKFLNLKIMNGNTQTGALYNFIDGGEYTHIENCELYKSTYLDNHAGCELVCNADSPLYKNVVIGSLADPISGAVRRPCVLFTKGIAGTGKVSRDVRFEKCEFWRKGGNNANVFVYAGAVDDIERMAKFVDCDFINNQLGTTMTNAFSSVGTNGHILIKNGMRSPNVTNWAASATNANVYALSVTGAANAGGLPVQQTA
jgi:hypothetical protein